jgi:hypothetical protein
LQFVFVIPVSNKKIKIKIKIKKDKMFCFFAYFAASAQLSIVAPSKRATTHRHHQ